MHDLRGLFNLVASGCSKLHYSAGARLVRSCVRLAGL